MEKRIFINADDPEEIRIAMTVDGRLEEIYIERASAETYLGNIYKGVVTNIEPSIGAAFVDFGGDRNGFLHASDILPLYRANNPSIADEELKEDARGKHEKRNIQEYVMKGQEVLVQVTKDGIGKKGPTLTTYLSIPGRYLVLMPSLTRSGVSKKIEDREERARLKQLLERIDPPPGMGYIIRTAGVGRTEEELSKDLDYLLKLWNTIVKRVRGERAPAVVYQESDIVIRTIRDVFTSDVGEVLIDSEPVYRKAKEFLRAVMSDHEERVKLYSDRRPLFHAYQLEDEIDRVFQRKVNLKSGGSLIIDQTEALVSIDVNSGKYRDEDGLEETAFRTNMEAVTEIARHLRLRDLGGVIINDFIDMQDDRHKRELEKSLRESLKDHKERMKVARISPFGMIEMTRQRVRPSLNRSNSLPCPHCKGSGWVKTVDSVGLKILREVSDVFFRNKARRVRVRANPRVADFLRRNKAEKIRDLEQHYEKPILVVGDHDLGTEDYEVQRLK
ncbi:MAG TPA: Rne/Rng family ribonuclease [Planctomycetota bacterium]|nr:Rne/Rng family ribonuclease [Planctomycetota bacterium]